MTYREIILKQVAEDGYSGLVALMDCASNEELLNAFGPRLEATDWTDYDDEDYSNESTNQK